MIIIGRGKEKNNLVRYIKRNNLSKNIKLINFLDSPFNLIRSSDLFILTSIYEGLPNVLLEAQTLKKFIISSDCPTGPKEILDNGKYGTLFKSGNSDDLCKKLILISKKKTKY